MKNLIREVLPKNISDKLRAFNKKAKQKLISTASTTKFLSSAYYIINREFSEENQAVLKGRRAYYESLYNIGESSALLRRNIHRIEKGLIMRPRRNVFAESFIQDTVECYKNAISSNSLNLSESKWATDVLDEYFRIIGSSPIIETAKETYTQIQKEFLSCNSEISIFPSLDYKYKPYIHDNLPTPTIQFNELKQLFIRRRSVRWFKDKAIPISIIEKATNIASLAPSACNRQPYRFIFCSDKQKSISIANCAMGTKGFAENIPAIIVIVGDLSAYPAERDRHVIYIDASLAAMQLMLSLETLGLSTCPINWPDISKRDIELRKIIDLEGYERVIMLMAVGYADPLGGIAYSQKKDTKLILQDITQ